MICSSFGVDSAELLDAMGDDVGVRARRRARGGPDGAPAPEAAAGGRLASTPAGPYSCSPMDIFVYYNTPEVADANNCCEHQDYGHISADIFLGTPGLEVIDESAHLPGLYAADGVTLARQPEEDEWLQIETVLTPHRDVVVFLGDSVQQILRDRAYKGTWHRVGKASQERVAVVYKVRPRDDFPWPQMPALLAKIQDKEQICDLLRTASQTAPEAGVAMPHVVPHPRDRTVDGAALARLRSMGFDDERATAALEQHPGDVHAAVASLLA